ncbi:hypothetical protein AVEN_26281-1 [Araneus ventricosus]|uniref:Uncharacterized protein n=1 Tax=Araneus ventricosus TaxID=182803 RepID=A0A4Y2AM60_ARAVE|nr:hypothetical protein AVEN_26281-1 [Araneus ventricosus]
MENDALFNEYSREHGEQLKIIPTEVSFIDGIREDDITQIEILVCSNLALQICKLAASLTRQECKLETNYCKRRSHNASNLQLSCYVKLIANYSRNRVRRQISDSHPDNPLPKPVALATQAAGP